ncbi:MAG: magnesium/cobalt transporter CorA [Micavibrio sp.]
MVKHKKYFHRKRHKPGTDPGTLSPSQSAAPVAIRIIAYDSEKFVEATLKNIEEIKDYYGKWPMVWINIDGLGDIGAIQAIGEIFNLHPLALEDTVNVHQRPKTEDYETNIYAVCRMANDTGGGDLDLEQISIFLGKDFVLSFQESPGDCWDPVRDRLRRGAGKRIRTAGADYLAYTLFDAVVDDYFPLLEKFGDKLDELEERVLDNPDRSAMIEIQMAKRYLHTIRHTVWPLRESIGQLMNSEQLVDPSTKVFLRDCQDHVIQVLDIVESYRERVSGLMDIYLSSLSIRMNEVMKVLAVITTIFMPLTFIAGIYGMNFNTDLPFNMPELNMPYGYLVTIGIMALIALVMILYFRKVGWLTRSGK